MDETGTCGTDDQADGCKSLGDILHDELDGAISDICTPETDLSAQKERLGTAYARIHREQPERSALCLSGGGIRSATFGLGVIQGLAQRGLLEKFDYLSTVSGGGYIGGWLTAWIQHHKDGRAGVMHALKEPPKEALHPEHPPIRHLRGFSSYLAPRLGFFSADTWTLAATFLRNMLLNWLVLLSIFAALLMIPRLCVLAVMTLQPTLITLNFLLGAATLLIAWAMAYAILDTPGTGNARWSQSRFVRWRQIPLFLSALLLSAWWACFANTDPLAEGYVTFGSMLFVIFVIGNYVIGGLIGNVAISIRRVRRARETPMASVKHGIQRTFAILAVTAVGGLLLWTIPAIIFPHPARMPRGFVCFAPTLILGVLTVVNFLFVGFASRLSEDEDREWWGRSAAWFLITMAAWSAFASISLFGPDISTALLDAVLPSKLSTNSAINTVVGGLGGFAGLITAWLGFSSKTSASATVITPRARQALMLGATLLFFFFLSLGLSRLLGDDLSSQGKVNSLWIDKWITQFDPQKLQQASPYAAGELRKRNQVIFETGVLIALLITGAGLGFVIDVNKFSLHSMYRSRLIRAFLGASRVSETGDAPDGTAGGRQSHLFTGFDPEDDLPMAKLEAVKPFHVVNIALNVVKGQRLAWQQRKAQSFTVSRLHCGSWHLGYRPSARYGGEITLGTAIAISGAAANSNMGYNSSPLVSFLMTLFNVRLGWWLGNPGTAGDRTFDREGPMYSAGPLLSEAFGHTTSTYKYVNLSDGGHFENLGLYEMTLRRCRFIVVVDAGQDSACEAKSGRCFVYEDLGNAIRKIRIDMGVVIKFDGPLVEPDGDDSPAVHYALGTIRYPELDESGNAITGRLLYIKPVLCADEPADVRNYATGHPEFPHESTSDQFFSESQFESYRALGAHTIDTLRGAAQSPKSWEEFFKGLESSADSLGNKRA